MALSNKDKIRKIYEVLPKLDDRRCGYKTCGEFAKAVAEGKEPCYGCVTGGPEVAAKVCKIMGAELPQQATSQPSRNPGFYQPRIGVVVGTGRMRQGFGRGRGIRGGSGRGRGFGQGRRGRWS